MLWCPSYFLQLWTSVLFGLWRQSGRQISLPDIQSHAQIMHYLNKMVIAGLCICCVKKIYRKAEKMYFSCTLFFFYVLISYGSKSSTEIMNCGNICMVFCATRQGFYLIDNNLFHNYLVHSLVKSLFIIGRFGHSVVAFSW